MISRRALFLVEKSGLSDKDKSFLKTHIETFSDLIGFLEKDVDHLKGEISYLKDIIDQARYWDNETMKIREELSKTNTEKLDRILNYINGTGSFSGIWGKN